MMPVRLPPPEPRPVSNFLTGAGLTLCALTDDLTLDNEGVTQITTTCNQPVVYTVLFARRLASRPYSYEDAQRFVEWARRGWREEAYFVFLIRRQSGEVVGALDIKSNTPEAAEVGYWVSAQHPGVMTNAVREMLQIVRGAGYRSLFARVRVENIRSRGVLRRSGFSQGESFTDGGVPYLPYTLDLAGTA